MRKREALPKDESTSDHAHRAAKALLGMIPAVGTTATELFEATFRPVLEQRREAWFGMLAEDLDALRDAIGGPAFERLGENPAFQTAVMHATIVALRTHREEKIDALRAGLSNLAIEPAKADLIGHVFISWIDDMTSDHLNMLGKIAKEHERLAANHKLSDEKTEAFVAELLGLADVVVYGSKKWKLNNSLGRQILRDLETRGLIHVNISPAGSWDGRIVAIRLEPLGGEFIRFTTPPLSVQGSEDAPL